MHPHHPIVRLRPKRAALCLLASATACSVPQDHFRSQGGTSPDPSAILRGSVLYQGPRPRCDYAAGEPVRVRGRVVLTLFPFADPPPPEGRAQAPANLMFVNGDALFSLSDCAPEQNDELESAIVRSTAFSWPALALARTETELQLRGFFDADEDMNPFFDVTRMPSAGDVIGAALGDDGLTPRRITLPAREAAPDGFRTESVLVSLAASVRSERPIFRLSTARVLSAEATLPLVLDGSALAEDPAACIARPSACVDRVALLAGSQALVCDESGESCGFRIEALPEGEVSATFLAAGISTDLSPEGSAFYTAPIDLVTVRTDAPDLDAPDGQPDPHPIFGGIAEVPWYAPWLVLQRHAPEAAQAERERAAGIPEVTLVGSPLLDESGDLPARSVYVGSVPMAIAPVALVDLDPSHEGCRVPYVPPGNVASVYTERLVHCGELPTGVFSPSVIAGVAGGQRVADPASDLGFGYQGARLSGQAWQIPNELADPHQVGAANALVEQGERAVFVVHDPRPARSGDCSQAVDALSAAVDDLPALVPVTLRGLCDEGGPLRVRELALGLDAPSCLPRVCCEAVAHLCGLPLCPVCDEETCPELAAQGLGVRAGPSSTRSDENGRNVPDCVPFALPSQCCDG